MRAEDTGPITLSVLKQVEKSNILNLFIYRPIKKV